jgi:hypothetical protein
MGIRTTLRLIAIAAVVLAWIAFEFVATRVEKHEEPIIAAINAGWTANDNDNLAALKTKLQADVTKLQADSTELQAGVARCRSLVAKDCVPLLAETGDVAGWHFADVPIGDRFNTQDDCADEWAKTQCDPANPNNQNPMFQKMFQENNSTIDDDRSGIDDDRTKITNFKFRANEYAIVVEKTNNYEGNIISYVDIRTKGADDFDRYKVTMKRQNNTLSIVSMESSPESSPQ